jgi:hypothetical protein
MARCSEAARDQANAAREYAEFLDAWKQGNPDMPQINHAREFLAGPKNRSTTTK